MKNLKTIISYISSPIEEIYRPASEVLGELSTFNNYFTCEDVQYLITYLKLATRQIKEDDELIQKMLADKVLVDDYKKHYEKDWW